MSNSFLPASNNESWLKSPNRWKSNHLAHFSHGNGEPTTLLPAAWEQPRPLGGSVAAHEAPVSAEATGGRREEPWVRGSRCWGGAGVDLVPERGCPGLGAGTHAAGSYLLLQKRCPLCSFISRMTAQHRINSELNLGKKGLRDFWFCFSQDSPGLLLVLPMTGVHGTTPGASVGRKFLSYLLKWRLYFWEQCRFTVTLRGVEISHTLPVAPPSPPSTGPSALHSPHHPPGEDSVSFTVFFAGFILGHRISQKQQWSPSLLWWREVTESGHQLSWDQTEETCFGSQWRIAVRAWTLEPSPGSTPHMLCDLRHVS